MKISEIKNMSPDELNEKLTESINELKQLKFNHSVQSIENPLQIKVLRRQIARMKTIINEKKED
ncbi:MAG: 50S ribosomal protein L29 [Bacteroidota bacterium]|nr:50S ribosomal protein L29 [Bacteroidota bacterium]|tara:strand:- start:562 stop:753 length:192 start_codon:yes stop_codon:yes gene_type:complete